MNQNFNSANLGFKSANFPIDNINENSKYIVSFNASLPFVVDVQVQLITYWRVNGKTEIQHHPSETIHITPDNQQYSVAIHTLRAMEGSQAYSLLSFFSLEQGKPEDKHYFELKNILLTNEVYTLRKIDRISKIAHIDTFGVKCGIATYLEGLLAGENGMIQTDRDISQIVFAEQIPDGDNRERDHLGWLDNWPKVIRNWHRRQPIDKLLDDLKTESPDILHIQHEWSFFNVGDQRLLDILRLSKKLGSANFVTWHTVYDYSPIHTKYQQEIAQFVDMNIVHTKTCYNNLVNSGIDKAKIKHIPMWSYVRNPIDSQQIIASIDRDKIDMRKKILPEKYHNKKIIITGGFLLPNKGVDRLIMSIATLPDKNDIVLICIGGEHPWSLKVYHDYFDLCKSIASQMNVEVFYDYRFMDDIEIENYFRCADMVVLNYGPTLSGTSGWSRRAIAYGRPAIMSESLLFQDLKDGVHCIKTKCNDVGGMATAISNLFLDINSRGQESKRLVKNAIEYANKIAIPVIADCHLNLYKKVMIGTGV